MPELARDRYAAFLKHNAAMLWKEGTDKRQVLFDAYWKDRPGPDEEIDLTVQLSGAMLLEGVALLDQKSLLN